MNQVRSNEMVKFRSVSSSSMLSGVVLLATLLFSSDLEACSTLFENGSSISSNEERYLVRASKQGVSVRAVVADNKLWDVEVVYNAEIVGRNRVLGSHSVRLQVSDFHVGVTELKGTKYLSLRLNETVEAFPVEQATLALRFELGYEIRAPWSRILIPLEDGGQPVEIRGHLPNLQTNLVSALIAKGLGRNNVVAIPSTRVHSTSELLEETGYF